MILPSGTLEMERGAVLFGDKDPDRPVLDFGGRMQAGGYEITAQIGGTLDNPEVVLASTPPLLQEELLLFVLTGAPPTSGGVNGGSVSAMATPMAVYLGKGVVDEVLGGAGARQRIRSRGAAGAADRPGDDAKRERDRRRATSL